MTVFKTFFKVLNKNKVFIFIYTVILLIFSISNSTTSENAINYEDTKANFVIINNDKEGIISNDFIEYVNNNAKVSDITSEDAINDALFYRQIDYVVYLPNNFSNDFMSGKNPIIDVKSVGSYESTLAERLVSNYFKILKIYLNNGYVDNELLSKTKEALVTNVSSEIISKVDVDKISKMSFYFNFESYSIIACLIYIICLILSIFNNEKIRKRTIISSTNYKKNNRILLLANCIYSFIVWFFYTLVAFILFKNSMFTSAGLVFIINSLLFTICITSMAFMIGNIVNNKDAINGIVNIIAIGSSFLCGAFVPVEYLPNGVLKFAHILPTYYYINSNELLQVIEEYNFKSLKPIYFNMIMIIIFTLLFVILTNIFIKKKRKIG